MLTNQELDIYTVLFVDDEVSILSSLKRELRKEPYKKIFVSSGDEALKICEENDITVLITDMRMPNLSGLELLKIVKVKYPNIVRIVLSGYTQITTLLSAINSGDIYKYITKPWQLNEELVPVIRSSIEKYISDHEKNDQLEELDNQLKVMNEKFSEIDSSLDKESLIKDTRLTSYISFIDQFNSEINSYNNEYLFKIFEEINPKQYLKNRHFINKLNYELERVKLLNNLLLKGHDKKIDTLNFNNVYKRIIERYQTHIDSFKISTEIIETEIIEISTHRRLMIFLLEEIIKKTLLLGICNKISTSFYIKNSSRYIEIKIGLNIKFNSYNISFENLYLSAYIKFLVLTSNISIDFIKKDKEGIIILKLS